jgi:hypothetical protein
MDYEPNRNGARGRITEPKMNVKGCVHVHVKDGNIANVFSHLTDLPENCVIHLVPDAVLSEEQFIESHPVDENELRMEPKRTVFDLGDEAI